MPNFMRGPFVLQLSEGNVGGRFAAGLKSVCKRALEEMGNRKWDVGWDRDGLVLGGTSAEGVASGRPYGPEGLP
jgi:hypothetical protein